MSRASTPSPPPQDLWSSILDSVSSKRSTPSKQIVLLGEASSGRSTVASALLQKPPSLDTGQHSLDFALGYDWADIRDEADEDTLLRLSVYTVPSSSPSFLRLIPHFLPPKYAIQDTLIVIVLDWTRPWTFLEQLETWLQWIETWVKGDDSRELNVLREECRERLQFHLQHYAEPSTETTSIPSSLNNTTLPLGPGALTHNSSGLPIVVVCTKADLIDQETDLVRGGPSIMVKSKGGEWEERTDAIMQVLRTVCLKYGAALFYTTQQQSTLLALRQYALHMLFMATPPSGSNSDIVPFRNPFPFGYKPNALDRDSILIPAGWDSWGKITVLSDGFNCKSWGEAWEADVDSKSGQLGEGSAKKMFRKLVGSDMLEPTSRLAPLVLPLPEQSFLKEHWDENARKPQDPRNSFKNPNDTPGAGSNSAVVGPMGSVTFQMPTVERVLAVIEGEAGQPADPRRNFRKEPSTRSNVGLGVTPASRSPISPTLGSPPGSATSGQAQHDVLQNFFQSLLSSNSRAVSRPGSTAPSVVAGNAAGTTSAAGVTTSDGAATSLGEVNGKGSDD